MAASSGHEGYVLQELEHAANFLECEGEALSLVLSALHSGHTGLAIKLLQRGGSLQRLSSMHPAQNSPENTLLETMNAPIWMIAVYRALTHNDPKSWQAMQLWKFIEDHVMEEVNTEDCEVGIILGKKICLSLRSLVRILGRYYSSYDATVDKREVSYQDSESL